MSHLICSEIVINDLDILRRAVAGFVCRNFPDKMKLVWNEGKKDYKWYTKDTKAETQHGRCEHTIGWTRPDKKEGYYEIGVVRRKDGEGWSLVFDPFDPTLSNAVGMNNELLLAAYADEYIRDFAAKNGFMVEQSLDGEGNIQLTMSRD